MNPDLRKRYILKSDRFEHKAGQVCYRFIGHDYGLCRDDTEVTGKEHISMTLDPEGGYPFFTVAVDDVAEL